MKIGLLTPGPARDSRVWSGIPASLCDALDSLSVGVVEIDSNPPLLVREGLLAATALTTAARHGLSRPARALRLGRRQAGASPSMVGARNTVARRKLARLDGRLEATIQVHAECAVGSPTPMATYEDLTVVQAVSHGYQEFRYMGERSRARRVAQQGRAYRRATACCTTSRWARDSIVADYGVPPEKVHVVGVGANRTGTPAERDWFPPRFLFVGIDWRRKNGAAVVEAFAQVRTTHPSAELDLVGGHPGVGQPGVRGHGVLHLDVADERHRLDDLYRRATCFVLPSVVEPSAVAFVEAASFGLPSVGTSVGGSADLIGDGGVVVDPHDRVALVGAMRRMADPSTAAEFGARARDRSRLFTWPLVAARILTAAGVEGFDEPPLFALAGGEGRS